MDECGYVPRIGRAVMRRVVPMFLLLLVTAGCQSAPSEVAPSSAESPEGRGTEIPESLRCKRATDCAPEPSCYMTAPSCIAASSVVEQKCGEDADPVESRPKFGCECQEGQCMALAAQLASQ